MYLSLGRKALHYLVRLSPNSLRVNFVFDLCRLIEEILVKYIGEYNQTEIFRLCAYIRNQYCLDVSATGYLTLHPPYQKQKQKSKNEH